MIENFDEADTDGDGRVSFKEAMAFDQANSSSSATSSTTSSTTSSSDMANSEFAVMMRMMQLAQSYEVFGLTQQRSTVSVAG